MTQTNTNLNQLIINELTQAEYNAATINQNELYIVTDGVMQSTDVINALGYTPYNSTNPNGYITGISGSDVVSALGLIPASVDLDNLSSAGYNRFQAPISDLSTIRSRASNGQTAYENMDGAWTKVDRQVMSAVSLDYASNYNISLSNILPNDGNLYDVMITGNVTTGTTIGNFARIYINMSDLSTYIMLCFTRTRTSSTMEAAGSAIITAKSTSTISIVRESGTNLKGTANLWILKYRKVR